MNSKLSDYPNEVRGQPTEGGLKAKPGFGKEKRGVSAIAASELVPHPGADGAHITIQPRANRSV